MTASENRRLSFPINMQNISRKVVNAETTGNMINDKNCLLPRKELKEFKNNSNPVVLNSWFAVTSGLFYQFKHRFQEFKYKNEIMTTVPEIQLFRNSVTRRQNHRIRESENQSTNT